MSDLLKDLAEVVNGNAFDHCFDRINCVKFMRTHHATIQQNAEDVKEWEEFGRQIEKRLRHNDLGLVGGYPEMIDALLEKAMRLRALERSLKEFHGPELFKAVSKRADEILREGEPHDQD